MLRVPVVSLAGTVAMLSGLAAVGEGTLTTVGCVSPWRPPTTTRFAVGRCWARDCS